MVIQSTHLNFQKFNYNLPHQWLVGKVSSHGREEVNFWNTSITV